jgi:hypothetical protein
MSISLSVYFRTISIERNILNEGDISTQTYQFPHGLINESVSINYGEIIGPGGYLQITGDVWAVNKMLQTLSYRSPPNGNGYDFITFVLQVKIVPQNDPPVISISGTDLGLLFDDASVREVGGGSGLHARKCSVTVGRLQFIEHYKRLSRTRRSPEWRKLSNSQGQRTIFSGSLPYIVN